MSTSTSPGTGLSPEARGNASAPPAGWMQWSLAPPGCSIWIPRDRAELDKLGELQWRACPFLPEGCMALGAPWAARTGWGFGGRLSAATVGAQVYLAVTRALGDDTWETLVLGGATTLRPVAAWRQHLPEAGCVLGAVSLVTDGPQVTASVPILREHDEASPVVVIGAPESLTQGPDPITLATRGGGEREPRASTPRLERFGAAGAEVLAREVAVRRGELLAVWEHDGRFAVRDLATGRTTRPIPGEQPFRALLDPTPVDGAVLFEAWTGERGSVWAADRNGHATPLLAEPATSYDRFATDGEQAVWTRSRGLRGLDTFDHVELWTGRVERAAVTQPRRVQALPSGALPLLSLGSGWVALWRAGDDVRLIRLADGETRHLPAVPQLSWDGGSGGLVIAGEQVWARASLRGQPGNDLRLVARFELEALPKASKP